MRLEFIHDISEARKLGVVNQQMVVSVDYDPSEDAISDPEVHVYEEGKLIGEISKLLDKAEGSPLDAMLEAIDWRDMYANSKGRFEPAMQDMFGIKNALDKVTIR